MAKECPLVLNLLVEEDSILSNFMVLMEHGALHLIHSKIQMHTCTYNEWIHISF